MGYIIKNTQGLINTRLTDTGRQKLSQGNFNISYFQIGDSEVSYNTLPSTYNQFETFVLEPSFNAQNSAGSPQSNKENVKYPYFVDGSAGNTYGIPFMDSSISPVFNRAVMRGFFTGDTSQSQISWSALTNDQYAINSNYVIKMNSLNGTNKIDLIYNECFRDALRGPSVGDLITIYYDGNGLDNCLCSKPFPPLSPTPTPTVTPTNTPTLTPTPSPIPVCICVQIPPNPFAKIGDSMVSIAFSDCNDEVSAKEFDIALGTTICTKNFDSIVCADPTYNEFLQIYPPFILGDCSLCVEDCYCVTIRPDIELPSQIEFSYLNCSGELVNDLYIPQSGSSFCTNDPTSITSSSPFLPGYEILGNCALCSQNKCYCVNVTVGIFGLSDEDKKSFINPTSTIIYQDCNGEQKSLIFTSSTQFCTSNLGGVSYLSHGLTSVSIQGDCSVCQISGVTCSCYTVEVTNSGYLTYADCNGNIISQFVEVGTYTYCSQDTYPPQGYGDASATITVTKGDDCTQTGICSLPPVLLSNTKTIIDPCASPTPTPTPSATFCPTPTPSNPCPPPPPPNCVVDIKSCYPILTYRIVDICFDTVTLDRPTPDFSYLNGTCYGRVIIYPPAMVPFYDGYTPRPHWNDDVINYESVCFTDQFDVKIWNMNIPWSESPAGLYSSINKDYTQFGSIQYLGTKEYLGYASSSGQTDSSSVYYFNSLGDKITVKPEDQKAIGIVHYTNKTIDFFYGEKFALEPYEDVDDTTGQAREFRVHIPWIMWHKNPDCCHGQTFWVDPPGFDNLNLFQVQYLQSNENVDMNNPGMRYYHLWDNHPGIDGIPNRVGKVFPDSKIIVFDDEEIIAAMSYKSNRNWTLPAPRLSLITPNTCGTDTNSVSGILSADTETVYITYRLSNTRTFTNYLHSNYYSAIQGPNLCLPFSSQNVAVRFGPEFPCLNQPFVPTTTTTTFNPTTTTTTSIIPPITANCYTLISTATCENPCIFEYINYDGVTSYVAVDVENSPIRVCSRSTPKSFCDSYEIVMGYSCYSDLDCNPCWLTGFTFVVNGILLNPESTGYTIDLVYEPTSIISNGYPIFSNAYYSSNIYFNGTDWVFNSIYCPADESEPVSSPNYYEVILGSGNSPLGDYSFFCGRNYLSGSTICKEKTNLCLYINAKAGVSYTDLAQVTNSTTGEFYFIDWVSQYSIIYNTNQWVILDYSTSVASFSTLNPLDIFNTGSVIWVFLDLSIFQVGTSVNNCNINCECIKISNDSEIPGDITFLSYYDCNGIVQYKILKPGGSVEIYYQNTYFYLGGAVTLKDCDVIITIPNKNTTHKTTVYPYTTTTTTYYPYTTTTTTFCPTYCDQITGFFADTFEVLVQKVPTGERPSPSEWKIIDFTNQLTSTMINGFITQEGLTGNTFVVTQQEYDDAPYYNLNDYIPLTPVGFSGSQLNFGDEYYFYGDIETDIQATIYEMRYKINLGQSEFQSSSNPSWTQGTQSYVTEIGLYDSQKNLMIISKMQSPVVRQGIQQFLVKFDF